MRVHNHHQRLIAASPDRVGALLDTLSSPDDRLWPHENWPAMEFDRPLEVGADGGHAFVRYRVTEYTPGKHVLFDIHGPRGFSGTHVVRAEPAGDDTLLSHTIDGRAGGAFALTWLLAVRPLHDALIEDAFDKAERAMGTLHTPTRWSWWVRTLRRLAVRRSR